MGYKFNRMELAGSLGDLGTLLPLAMGLIMVCGLDPAGLFFAIGLFYILSGFYYQVPVAVQPMKVISSYAIAMALSATQVTAAGLLAGIFLLLIGGSGLINFVVRLVPLAVIRGVQLATGVLLMIQGVRFVAGTSSLQVMQGLAEPYLLAQDVAGLPMGIIIGLAAALLTFFFIDNKKLPAALLVIGGGLLMGLLWGRGAVFSGWSFGFKLPGLLPFGLPGGADFSFALLVLVLPQLPMTMGNAVIANSDLSQTYFGEDAARVTNRSLCFSMGLANILSFILGGMPLCHGAGGLAAHYRFGARTAGSNIIIGVIFLALALFLGSMALAVIQLIPFAVLGVLLVFAGQLGLTIIDLQERRDIFICLLMLAITLAVNLAVGFMVGILVDWLLRRRAVVL